MNNSLITVSRSILERLESDLKLADMTCDDRLEIIRQQAATIDDMKKTLDAQDKIIAKLRYGAK